MRLTRYRSCLILCLATLLAYANTLPNQFVWDDETLIKDNSFIRNSTYLATAVTTDLMHNSHAGTAYYRPAQTITYMLDYCFWGLNPIGYHLTNLLLHLACVLLVWAVIRQLARDDTIALVVALTFAVQPLNTNAVTYVAGRADSLALVGMLGAFALYTNYRQAARPRRLVLVAALLCYVLALFSRENALLFPALVFAATYLLEERNVRRAFTAALPFLLLMVVFVAWRFAVLQLIDKPLLAPWDIPVWLRLQIFLRALATYCGLLFWPAHLQMDRQIAHASLGLTVAGVACLAVLTGAIICATRRSPIALFGLVWFIITLAPTTGALNLVATVAEHWLYVPMIGFYLAVSIFIQQSVGTHRRLLMWGCIIVFAAMTARTIRRNEDWADSDVFFTRTSQAAKDSERVRTNLGNSLFIDGRTTESLQVLLEAKRLNPRSTMAKYNLAVVYLKLGELDQARQELDECAALDPTDPTVWNLVAQIHESQGNFKLAQRHYRQALVANNDLGPRLVYGDFLVRQGHLKKALAIVDECHQLEPGNARTFNLLGMLLERGGQFDKAAEAFRYAATLDRHSDEARQNLIRCLRTQAARAAQALQQVPGYADQAL